MAIEETQVDAFLSNPSRVFINVTYIGQVNYLGTQNGYNWVIYPSENN